MRLVAIGALVAACSGRPASAPAAGSAAVAPPAARTVSPDAAYLQLRGAIVAIESGAFRTIDGSEPARGFVARPGGGGWFIHGGGIARYDGGGLVPLAGVPAQHEPRAAGPDGSLYTA